jgi:hypothetical protein
MNRRAFIKALGVLAATPALGKYLNLFKSGGVREGITQAVDKGMDKGMDFYNLVIKKVVDEGTMVKEQDRFRTYTHPDRPDISVDVNVGTGDSAVYFDTDQGSKGFAEITSDIEAPKAGKELIEGEEVYKGFGPDGDYYKDIDEGEIRGGLTSLEEWIKMKRGYAAGGRVGMWKGGVPKGLQAALRLIRGKFGDDAIRTADEIERPPGAIEVEETAQAVNDFNIRNPSSITETVNIWEDPTKVRAAVDDIFPTGDYKYDAEMAAEALVENNPAAFGGKLIDDIDDATRSDIYGAVLRVITGDMAKMREMRKLSKPTHTLAGIKNTGTINISDPNVAEEFSRFMKEHGDPAMKQGLKELEENLKLSNFDIKGRKKNAQGGIIGLTNNPMTASSKAGVESLFERR